MENTRAHPSVQGWEDPHNSKYYLVIVQVGGWGLLGAGCMVAVRGRVDGSGA
jgi:hypothetical protein